MEISTSKSRRLLAAAAALITGPVAFAVLATGCSHHPDRQSAGNRERTSSYDSSLQATAPDSTGADSGYGGFPYGGTGSGTGGSGYDSTMMDSSRIYLDTMQDPYHYPGTVIPGGEGQGGSGGIPDWDTSGTRTPSDSIRTPTDSIGTPDFNERG